MITIKDIFYLSAQEINPLTKEDLKKILDQQTLQAKLCDNPILVNVDEIQNSVIDTQREKVNQQEPPSIIPLVTIVQPLVQMLKARSTKVDIVAKIDIVEKEIVEEQAIIVR